MATFLELVSIAALVGSVVEMNSDVYLSLMLVISAAALVVTSVLVDVRCARQEVDG